MRRTYKKDSVGVAWNVRENEGNKYTDGSVMSCYHARCVVWPTSFSDKFKGLRRRKR